MPMVQRMVALVFGFVMIMACNHAPATSDALASQPAPAPAMAAPVSDPAPSATLSKADALLADLAQREEQFKKIEAERDARRAEIPVVVEFSKPVGKSIPTGAAAVIDRSKFDRVYEAGKLVEVTSTAGNRFRFQDALVDYRRQISIAQDRAATQAERDLAGEFLLSYFEFNLASTMATTVISRSDAQVYGEQLRKAFATLERASSQYLAKP
jgi:hypothetical protein